MKKRITKTERKNKLRRKKKKELYRFKESLPKEPAFSMLLSTQQKSIVLTCLLAGLLFFYFPALGLADPAPTPVYYNQNIVSIVSANATNPKTLELPINPVELSPAEIAALQKTKNLKKDITVIIKDTPMEKMIIDISKKDRTVAAFIVGIAMKESKFGRYSPKKNGVDCYNYWGYRGKENTTASGYSCFDSPSHAISVVGGRIASMVKQGAHTPADMISWKCGSTCAGFPSDDVTGWIKDVGINYYKLNPAKAVAINE